MVKRCFIEPQKRGDVFLYHLALYDYGTGKIEYIEIVNDFNVAVRVCTDYNNEQKKAVEVMLDNAVRLCNEID